MGPLAMMGIGVGANLLKDLLMPQKSGMVDPAEYKSMLMPNIGLMRQQALRNAQSAMMPGMAQMRQYGAAHRLPAGAIMSGIQGMGYRGAQAAAGIEPQLQEQQRQGALDYYNLQNQYGMGQAGARNAMSANLSSMFGNMTKLGVLWSSGFFDKPGGQAPQQPNVPLPGEEPEPILSAGGT